MDPGDSLAQLGHRASQDLQALQDYRDLLVLKAQRESQARQERQAPRDHVDPEAFRAYQEFVARQVYRAAVARLEVPAPRDYLDLKVL